MHLHLQDKAQHAPMCCSQALGLGGLRVEGLGFCLGLGVCGFGFEGQGFRHTWLAKSLWHAVLPLRSRVKATSDRPPSTPPACMPPL